MSDSEIEVQEEWRKARERVENPPPPADHVTEALHAHLDGIARVAHEARRAYRALVGRDAGEAYTDLSGARRDELRAEIRAAAGTLPSERHETWVREMVQNGWTAPPDLQLRQDGEIDAERKLHPHLVSWEELPVEVQREQRVGQAVIDALTASGVR